MPIMHVTLPRTASYRALSTGDGLGPYEIKFSEAGMPHATIVLPDTLSPDEVTAAMRELEAKGDVLGGWRAEKRLFPQFIVVPQDALSPQWAQGDSFDGVGVNSETRARGRNGRGVQVAVLDTVLDTMHPQFARMVADGRLQGDYGTDQAHATHVCAIITGDLGIAPGVTLYHQNVLPGGSGSESGIALGYQRAREWGAQIISASLGGAGASGVISDAVGACNRQGVLTVAAAGNGYSRANVGDPGRSSLLCVLAYDRSNPPHHADFTDGRTTADAALPRVSDPGLQIVSALPNGQAGPMSGTSMATPHRAGMCALLMGAA